jgi:acetamidase/formamidase
MTLKSPVLSKPVVHVLAALMLAFSFGCESGIEDLTTERKTSEDVSGETATMPEPDFTLDTSRTHSKFSRAIPAVLEVPSGSVIELFTEEATGGQLTVESTAADLATLDFDLIHALTGPIHVEGADPGDILAVTFYEIELGDWGWNAHMPGFGFLQEEFEEPWMRTWSFSPGQTHVEFEPGVEIPLAPFPGVVGVAPDTDEMLSTIPPRANGGNMDNKYITVGTTLYLPIFVEGALLSVGDTHAVQGDGEVCGTAIEAPMRLVIEVEVLDGRSIEEPQYETADYYAVTGFGTTIDEAAKKATRYMLDHLVSERGMAREDAYALVSLAGDLKISETVDMPHYLVSMHMPKEIFGTRGE